MAYDRSPSHTTGRDPRRTVDRNGPSVAATSPAHDTATTVNPPRWSQAASGSPNTATATTTAAPATDQPTMTRRHRSVAGAAMGVRRNAKRQGRARHQGHRPRQRAEVRIRRVGRPGRDDRRQADRPETDPHRCGPPPSGERQQAHEDRGPHQVELLLDGQGPEVSQRRRCDELGDVAAVHHLPPVVDVGQRCERLLREKRLTVDRPDPSDAGDRHRSQDQPGDGPQPPYAPSPEAREADRPLGLVLAQEERGDQVAREHEEQVDTDEAAPEARDVEVVGDHGRNREPPQSVERRQPARPSDTAPS